MFEYKEKRKIKKFLYSKPMIVLLVLILALLLKPAWGAYSKYSESKEISLRSQEKLEDLQKRHSDLISRIERLETEKGQEEEIIEKFNVAREGERVIIIVDPLETQQEEQKDPNKSFFSSLKGWLINFF